MITLQTTRILVIIITFLKKNNIAYMLDVKTYVVV